MKRYFRRARNPGNLGGGMRDHEIMELWSVDFLPFLVIKASWIGFSLKFHPLD